MSADQFKSKKNINVKMWHHLMATDLVIIYSLLWIWHHIVVIKCWFTCTQDCGRLSLQWL